MLGVDVIYEDFVTGTEMQVSFYIDTPLIATGDCDFYTSLLREKKGRKARIIMPNDILFHFT